MSQEADAIVTLYQLQKKYNCTVTSYYEENIRAMVFTATLNCPPWYQVILRIQEDELLARIVETTFEQEACQYFDMQFSQALKVMPGLDKKPISENKIINIGDWRQIHSGRHIQ